jgi:hypothetical protein
VGPASASALPHALPGTSTRQWARSSAISKSIGAYSIPRTSSISWGEAGGPASRLSSEDRLERLALGFVGALVDENPTAELVASPVQMLPSKPTTPTTLSASSAVSP